MRVIDLALKDLSQILRDKRSFLFLLAMPLIFTFFMGFAVGGSNSANADPRLVVGWVNNDGSSLISAQLKSLLQASDGLRLEDVAPADTANVAEQVKSGKLAAAVVVPAGFSASAFAGQQMQITLVADELSSTGQSALQLARVPVTRLMSAVEIARLNVAAAEAARPFASTAGRQKELETVFSMAIQEWQQSSAQGAKISLEKATGNASQEQKFAGNPYNQTSPGMLVQFAVFGLITSATILVQERKTHTMQRLVTTSMTPAQIIAGHLLAMFTIVLLQEILLIVFGQLVLHVNYLGAPGAILLMIVSVGLMVSSLGLLISVFARNEEQVTLISLIAMFVLTGLGGAWFPLEGTGQAFSAIGHLTPTAWAMDGFQNVLLRSQGLSSTLLPAGLLLVYAAIFFAIGVWRFKTE